MSIYVKYEDSIRFSYDSKGETKVKFFNRLTNRIKPDATEFLIGARNSENYYLMHWLQQVKGSLHYILYGILNIPNGLVC